MTRPINDSLSLLETTLGDITTSLGNKGVTAEGLKASQVPDKIREIELKKNPVLLTTEDGVLFSSQEDLTTNIVFTDIKAPFNTQTIDCSANHDMSVVKWKDTSTDTLYISTQKEGVKIALEGSAPYLFSYYDIGYKYNEKTTSIKFDNIDTSGLTDISSMFYGLNKMVDLDLRNFDTSNVTKMYSTFSDCTSLVNVDLSSFNTSKVSSFEEMFNACTSLVTLDLSTFSTEWMGNTKGMFYNCTALETIYATEWASQKSISSTGSKDMFNSCSRLPNYSWSGEDFRKAKWKENNGHFTNPAEKG